MMHLRLLPLCLLALTVVLLLPGEGQSKLDAVQDQLVRQYELPLRWDNVERAPLWINGPKPAHHWRAGMHLVRLRPGQTVTVRIPPGQRLRVRHPRKTLAPDDLDIAVSNGSGLYVFLPLQRAVEDNSLVLSPQAAAPLLARITRPAHSRRALDVALFVSRHEGLGEIAPYRNLVPRSSSGVRLRRGDQIDPEMFWRWEPQAPVMLRVHGPLRLLLETRLPYPPTASRLLQTYRVFVRLDGTTSQVLAFATSAEIFHPVYVNGRVQAVSRLEEGYIDIPPGDHLVQLDATAALYARLLQQGQPDYLLPQLNEPALSAQEVLAAGIPPLLHASSWEVSDAHVQSAMATHTVTERERIAGRLVRDNRRQDGGLLGAMLMHETAGQRPDYPRTRTVASAMLSFYTFARDLLPTNKQPEATQTFAHFIPRLLHELGKREPHRVAAEQHLDALLDRVTGAYFVDVPAQPANHVYRIPPRPAPSFVRVAVDTLALVLPQQELWLQFDDQAPLRLLVTPNLELPAAAYVPAQGDLGLELLRWQQHTLDTGTLGGPFSTSRLPGRLRRAGSFELSLPPTVRTIKVWRPQSGAGKLRVALQYRTAKPYRLSEAEYRDTVRRFGPPQERYAFFVHVLTSPEHMTPIPPLHKQRMAHAIAAAELANQWVPLRRLLRSQAKILTAAVSPPASITLPQADHLSAVQLDALREQAQQQEATGRWIAALEIWSRILYGSDGARQREAQLARVTALQNLGEHFLAEQMLRGMWLYAPDTILQEQAFERLEHLYREASDTDALQILFATTALRQPNPATFRELATLLAADGQHEMALMIGLALPPPEQPLSLMLRATWKLGWWQIFAELAERLPSVEQRQYWLGYRALRLGDYAAAFTHWRQAGAQGEAVATALRDGLILHAELAAPYPEQREQAVLAWEQWQERHPGPHAWRQELQLATDYAAAENLYSVARDLYAWAFRSTKNRPVKLRVMGPIQLRIFARPVHPQGATEPLDGWLQVRFADQLRLLPINNNRPVLGLRIVGDEAWTPGREVVDEYTFGPGLHEVEVSAGALPVLVRVFARRPDMPLGVLPPLTPETVLAAVQRQAPRQTITPRPIKRRATHVGFFCPACLTIVPRAPDATRVIHQLPLWMEPFAPPQVDWRHQALTVLPTRLTALRGAEPPAPALVAQTAQALAQDNIDAALVLPMGNSDADILRRMSLIVWLAEQHPERYAEALSLGESLVATHARVSGLQALLGRLTRNSKWSHLATVESSAGLRFLEIEGWQPESPALRLRKALLRPVQVEEHVLSGHSRMVVSLRNVQPAILQIGLTLEDIAYLPPHAMTVLVQVDAQEPRHIVLTPGQPHHMQRLTMPVGDHTLRVSIDGPLANQFLRLRIIELFDGDQEPLIQSFERPYHVATHDEPVQVQVSGPTWLRLDELRDETTITRYQRVEPGWQEVEVRPSAGQRETLIRLHQRIPDPDREPVPSRYAPIKPDPVPEPLVRLDTPELPTNIRLHDAHPLGWQEDGTWSISGSFARRRNVEEDVQGNTTEQSLEVDATHRYFDAYRRLYYKADVRRRIRQDSGPTLGLEEDVTYLPTWAPLTFRVRGSLFLQLPINGTDAAAWSGALRGAVSQRHDIGPKTWFRPTLSLFGRHVSLDRLPNNAARVDQDVFTPYKATHRRGIQLSDALTHRPWLDTLWIGGVSLTSNEDFNPLQPDNVNLRFGWKQLLGDFQVDITYRFSHFFADDNRDRALNRHLVIFDLLWERWRFINQERLEARLRLRQDVISGDNSLFFTVSWHFGAGRAYRDFRPGEVDFLDIRQRRVPHAWNNRINRLSYEQAHPTGTP